MRVMLTNDDGINAPGIIALHDALLASEGGVPPVADEVMVVAPMTVQSATGHGVTFRTPLMTKRVRLAECGARAVSPVARAEDQGIGLAVDGRPADCTKLGVAALWPERFGPGSRPDVVISGMNMGCNVGINVLYSGTVAAAVEAAFLGVPAIAVSLHLGAEPADYRLAGRWAAAVIRRVLAAGAGGGAGLGAHECVSINLPRTGGAVRECQVPPVVVCPMNTHGSIDAFTRNVSPMGEVYYWSAGSPMDFHSTEAGSDVEHMLAGRITVTPLKYDMTDHAAAERWSRVFGG
jgi:5'-nucleotidase